MREKQKERCMRADNMILRINLALEKWSVRFVRIGAIGILLLFLHCYKECISMLQSCQTLQGRKCSVGFNIFLKRLTGIKCQIFKFCAK